MTYNYDQLPFADMKARYRSWLAGRKLNDEKQVCEIFGNISTILR